MAHQEARQREKIKRAVASPPGRRRSPRQPRKPAKISLARPDTSPPIQRPAALTKEPRKTKTRQTVSVAGIFKKSKSSRHKHDKHHRRREATPEPDLLADLTDGIAEARAALDTKNRASFEKVHASLTARIASTREKDTAFFQDMAEAADKLTAPLADEQVQSVTMEHGKRVVKMYRIGDRVERIKEMVDQEEKRLLDLWKQWDEVQAEYVELGVDVFGREAFGLDREGREKGYKREMELIDVETATRVEELAEDIEDIGPDIMKKMKASEKELDSNAKKEQARLISTLL
ncbi:hypothetical protein LZ554_001305 [Drepanopeziza brunnea f. sp. 'monogermtubi']|nr:hypothetical protein LZ554_001305 [Drepanopeziza brunnea f. sp. 'monogermtubi']